jgi:hypothetical protein
VLTADVRFEGWTTEDWIRFLHLWHPRARAEREATRPHGGIVIVHEGANVLKVLDTRRGRLDPGSAQANGEASHVRALALPLDHPASLAAVARAHGTSWVLGVRLGALDEVMERLGARLKQEDDLTSQSLVLLGIVRELLAEGAIAAWPQRLRGFPIPTPHVIHRTVDTLCGDRRAITLGLFDGGGLWTCFVARRRGFSFDVIAGPDELRGALGLLSGDWRRDYRHLAASVEERYAPLGFGCFAELETFRSLQTDPSPGAWTRAVAVRDVIIAPMSTAMALGLGLDGLRYALRSLKTFITRVAPLGPLAPLLARARGSTGASEKALAAQIGFNPMAILRALLER